MINSISSVQASPYTQPAQAPAQKSRPAPSDSAQPQDTVQLSQAAQKALAGDMDHDGDSH
jgi:hypothetical protein